MVIMVFDHIYTGCQQSKPSNAVWNTFGNDFWSSFNGEGEEQKPLGSGELVWHPHIWVWVRTGQSELWDERKLFCAGIPLWIRSSGIYWNCAAVGIWRCLIGISRGFPCRQDVLVLLCIQVESVAVTAMQIVANFTIFRALTRRVDWTFLTLWMYLTSTD